MFFEFFRVFKPFTNHAFPKFQQDVPPYHLKHLTSWGEHAHEATGKVRELEVQRAGPGHPQMVVKSKGHREIPWKWKPRLVKKM